MRTNHRLQVTVANGDCILSLGVGRALPLEIGKDSFSVDYYVIPLDEFDVVLGVQWLATLGPILWDFSKLTLMFWLRDRSVWSGVEAPSAPPVTLQCTGGDLMTALLDGFTDVFAEPTGLLPERRHWSHHIHLLLGTTPIAVRPYHYPQHLKDELER